MPIGAATGIIPQEFVEDTMASLVSSYNEKIQNCEDNSNSLMAEAVQLRRRGKNKDALGKMRKAKMEQNKITMYEKQKDNLEIQLESATDRRLTVETLKVMGEHKKLLKNEFGAKAVEEAEDLMASMKEHHGDFTSLQDALAQPIADGIEVEYEFDDSSLMAELDAIAFQREGENVSYENPLPRAEYTTRGDGYYSSHEPPVRSPVAHREDRPKTSKVKAKRTKSKRQIKRALDAEGREETLADILGE